MTKTRKIDALASSLANYFGDRLSASETAFGQITIDVTADNLIDVATELRDRPEFAFEVLIDVCGIDYMTWGRADWETEQSTSTGFSRGVSPGQQQSGEGEENRFASIYQLLSISRNQRLRVRVFANGEPPVVPSVTSIWSSANWFEREAFDLFGILYAGHPDLRRILTDYGFIGHPFRKDFPLIGNVEVRYDPDQKRVIYQPVSIEPRTLVPRIIRDETGAVDAATDADDTASEVKNA